MSTILYIRDASAATTGISNTIRMDTDKQTPESSKDNVISLLTQEQMEATQEQQEPVKAHTEEDEKEQVIFQLLRYFHAGEERMRQMELQQLRSMLGELVTQEDEINTTDLRTMDAPPETKTVDGVALSRDNKGMLADLKEILPDLSQVHATMDDEELRKHYLEVMAQYNKGIIARKYFTKPEEPTKQEATKREVEAAPVFKREVAPKREM